MNWFQKISQSGYEYLGTCSSTVDISCIWDATQMAQLIENSEPLDVHKIIPFVSSGIRQKFEHSPDSFVGGTYRAIVWIHDLDQDIHYFYRRT